MPATSSNRHGRFQSRNDGKVAQGFSFSRVCGRLRRCRQVSTPAIYGLAALEAAPVALVGGPLRPMRTLGGSQCRKRGDQNRESATASVGRDYPSTGFGIEFARSRMSTRLTIIRGLVSAVSFWWLATAAIAPVAVAAPGWIPVPLGPQVGQSCNDPLRLAYDSSGQGVVCTRAGTWVQSVMPSTVHLLGSPCSPYDPVAKTPDDHLIGCQSGLWTLYHP